MAINLHKAFVFIILLLTTTVLKTQNIEKTKILVLGTTHLDQLSGVKSKHLDRVLDSLTQYEFDVICIEKMPVELLLDIRNRNSSHWQNLYSYFSDPIEKGEYYQGIFNMSYKEAQFIIDSLLAKKTLTETDRIYLMKASLSSYDPWTASLHYQYIPEKTVIDTTIAEFMNNYTRSVNEINLIGVNLARRLNINNLYPIDNLQDETILLHDFPEFMIDYKNSQEIISELIDNAFYGKIDSIQSGCISKGDLYDTYKFINSAEYMNADKKGQWDIWFKTNFKSKTDRSRYSLWEMRNLQITANIMRVVASNPEKNILVIIGSSHKFFIENHLKEISDVELLTF